MKLISDLKDERVVKFKETGDLKEFLTSLKPEDNIYIREYKVVEIDQSEHAKHPPRVVMNNMPPITFGLRDSCLDCVRKHLAKAYKKIEETIQGHSNNMIWAIAELEEAEEESLEKYPDLSAAIRNVRKSLLEE